MEANRILLVLKQRLLPLWEKPGAKPFLAGILLGLFAHMTYSVLHDAVTSRNTRLADAPPPPPSRVSFNTVPPAATAFSPPTVSAGGQNVLTREQAALLLKDVPPPLHGFVRQYVELMNRFRQEHEQLPEDQRASHRDMALRQMNELTTTLHLTIDKYPEVLKIEQETRNVLQR
jgi:hypothetical protein